MTLVMIRSVPFSRPSAVFVGSFRIAQHLAVAKVEVEYTGLTSFTTLEKAVPGVLAIRCSGNESQPLDEAVDGFNVHILFVDL